MGYRELLQALEEEVGRQIREGRAQAEQEHERLLDATRQELAAMREKVLEEERRRLEGEAARAVSRARLEDERTILTAMREEMEELLRQADVRLPAMNDADGLARLFDELVPELGDGPLELRVKQGHEQHLRDHLRRRHPELLPRATIQGSPHVRGGVEASLGGRQLLDNTLASRLRNVWQALETEVAASLFGDGHGRL